MVPSSADPAPIQKPASDTRRLLLKTGIYSLLALATFGTVTWFQSRTLRMQYAHMRAAEQHIPVLRPQLASDPRFARIELASFTASNGSLLVQGELNSHEALDDLKKRVLDSHPPTEVIYSVQVITPEMRKMAEEFRQKESTAAPP